LSWFDEGDADMTVIAAHLNSKDLEASYETAVEPVAKRHFHALWLLSCSYEVDEVAELLSFSPRWVWQLIRRYNEGGPGQLGDQRCHNGTTPSILTPEALAALQVRLKTPPDDGGVWSAPKVAQFLASFHKLGQVHDQRGWEALIALGYTVQKPRPRHPQAAGEPDRAALKKSWPRRSRRRNVNIPRRPSRSGPSTSTASA
jgi:transposase